MSLPPIDHLVYACSRLDDGLDRVEEALGTRPARGGRHPDFGTHNALLSLGPTTYLEVIAPDPTLPRPARGLAFGLSGLPVARLTTWALRCEDIERVAASTDVGLGPVESGTRETADGTVLRWRLTDPYAMPMEGAVPFLIGWGDTPHPATVAPPAGTLVGFRIGHPEPERVQRALDALGVSAEVRSADAVTFAVTLRTKRGVAELR